MLSVLKNPIFLLLQFCCTSCYYFKTELQLLAKSSQLISAWSARGLAILLCRQWGHAVPTPELLVRGNCSVSILLTPLSSSSPHTTVCVVTPPLIT